MNKRPSTLSTPWKGITNNAMHTKDVCSTSIYTVTQVKFVHQVAQGFITHKIPNVLFLFIEFVFPHYNPLILVTIKHHQRLYLTFPIQDIHLCFFCSTVAVFPMLTWNNLGPILKAYWTSVVIAAIKFVTYPSTIRQLLKPIQIITTKLLLLCTSTISRIMDTISCSSLMA